MAKKFANISRANTNNIDINQRLDYSIPFRIQTDVLKDRQSRADAATEQLANFNVKYKELLDKVRTVDYKDLETKLDSYLNERVDNVLKNNDLATSSMLGSTSFFSNSDISKMLQDKSLQDKAIALMQEAQKQGKSGTIFGDSFLTKTSSSITDEERVKLQGMELPDFNAAQDPFIEDLKADTQVWGLSKADTFLLRTGSTEKLSNYKIKEAVDRNFNGYMNSEAGKLQLRTLTERNFNNPIPMSKQQALMTIKSQMLNRALNQQFQKDSQNFINIPQERTSGKGSTKSKTGNFIPTASPLFRELSKDKNVIGQVYDYKPVLVGNSDLGANNYYDIDGNPIAKPNLSTDASYTVQTRYKIVGAEDAKGNPIQSDVIGKILHTGKEGTIKTSPDAKPDKNGFVIDENKNRYKVQETVYHVVNDKNDTYYAEMPRSKSLALTGRNLTGKPFIDINQNGFYQPNLTDSDKSILNNLFNNGALSEDQAVIYAWSITDGLKQSGSANFATLRGKPIEINGKPITNDEAAQLANDLYNIGVGYQARLQMNKEFNNFDLGYTDSQKTTNKEPEDTEE